MAVLAVDVGGTNIRTALVERDAVEALSRHPHAAKNRSTSYDRLIAHIVDAHGMARTAISGVGISISGLLSADRTSVSSNELHPDWNGRRLVQDLEYALDVPVVVENDGNCAAWAEYRSGVGQGSDPFVLLTLGTGLGGGTIVGGRLVTGSHGAAGEFGHIKVGTDGTCVCGESNCLEAAASGSSLMRIYSRQGYSRTRAAAGSGPTHESFAARLDAGEPVAVGVLEDLCRSLASGIATISRILDPKVVGLGGGLSALDHRLTDRLTRALDAIPRLASRDIRTRVAIARHGDTAGMLGAAYLLHDRTG